MGDSGRNPRITDRASRQQEALDATGCAAIIVGRPGIVIDAAQSIRNVVSGALVEASLVPGHPNAAYSPSGLMAIRV
jgi:hypothetical protein